MLQSRCRYGTVCLTWLLPWSLRLASLLVLTSAAKQMKLHSSAYLVCFVCSTIHLARPQCETQHIATYKPLSCETLRARSRLLEPLEPLLRDIVEPPLALAFGCFDPVFHWIGHAKPAYGATPLELSPNTTVAQNGLEDDDVLVVHARILSTITLWRQDFPAYHIRWISTHDTDIDHHHGQHNPSRHATLMTQHGHFGGIEAASHLQHEGGNNFVAEVGHVSSGLTVDCRAVLIGDFRVGQRLEFRASRYYMAAYVYVVVTSTY